MINILTYQIKQNQGQWTTSSDGYNIHVSQMLLISNSENEKIHSYDIVKILEFLTFHPDSINAVWNVDEFIAPILAFLTKDQLLKLHRTKKVYIAPYSLFYIQEKMFSVKKAHANQKPIMFYRLDQYFPRLEDEPDDLAPYAIKVAEALDIMKLQPSKLTSPIAIYEECIMRHLSLPNWDIPKGTMLYALECAGKLWIEAYKVGYFKKIFDFDMKSCFSSIAMDLVDTRHLDWIESPEYQPNASYGYCKGQVTIKSNVTISPIIYHDAKGSSSTPVGTWRTYLTKSEIDFIHKWKIGYFEIENGWWGMKPDRELKDTDYPLKHPILAMLDLKEHKNTVVSDIAKRVVNGLYGKTLEVQGDTYGPYFNPAWGAEISTRARLNVAQFIYTNKLVNDVIHVSVDGVASLKEVKL